MRGIRPCQRRKARGAAQRPAFCRPGRFTPAADARAAERRRTALAEHERLTREIATLRSHADKENQINRRVDWNLQVKALEAGLVELAAQL